MRGVAGRERSSYGSALGAPGFRLLLTARITSLLGTAVAPVGLAFAVLQATGRPADLGLALAARQLPLVALLLVGGVLGDRVAHRERLLVVTDTVAGCAQTATATLALTGSLRLLPLCVLQAVGGAAAAFAGPALTGLVPTLVPPAGRPAANALLSVSRSGTLLLGAPLGGLLAALASPGWALAADAVSYLLGAGCLLALAVGPLRGRRDTGPRLERSSVLLDLREGAAVVWRLRWLWVVVAQFGVLLGAGDGAFLVLGPVVARSSYGGAAAYGALLALQAAGSFSGALIAARASWRRPLLAGVVGTLGIPATLALLAGPAPLAVTLTASAIAGIGLGAFDVVWGTALQQHVPPHALSRVAALDQAGSLSLLPLGTTLAGIAATTIGVRTTLLGCAALATAVTLAALAVRDVRELPPRSSSSAPPRSESLAREQP